MSYNKNVPKREQNKNCKWNSICDKELCTSLCCESMTNTVNYFVKLQPLIKYTLLLKQILSKGIDKYDSQENY